MQLYQELSVSMQTRPLKLPSLMPSYHWWVIQSITFDRISNIYLWLHCLSNGLIYVIQVSSGQVVECRVVLMSSRNQYCNPVVVNSCNPVVSCDPVVIQLWSRLLVCSFEVCCVLVCSSGACCVQVRLRCGCDVIVALCRLIVSALLQTCDVRMRFCLANCSGRFWAAFCKHRTFFGDFAVAVLWAGMDARMSATC